MKQEISKQQSYSRKAEVRRKDLMLNDPEYREKRLAWRRANYAKNKDTIRAAVKADRKANPEKYRARERQQWKSGNRVEKQRQYRLSIKAEVFKHYGNKCKCCGESTIEFLALDHKNRDGAEHRRQILGDNEAGGTYRMMLWIRKNNFPKTFQILCHNCNIGRERNNGVCPHKRRKR